MTCFLVRQLPPKPTSGAHHSGEAAYELRQRAGNGGPVPKEDDFLPASEHGMLYLVDDAPPWYSCIVLGLQVRFVCALMVL